MPDPPISPLSLNRSVFRAPGSVEHAPPGFLPILQNPRGGHASHTHSTDVATGAWGSEVPCSGSPVSTGPSPACNPGLSCLLQDITAHLRAPGVLLLCCGAWVEGEGQPPSMGCIGGGVGTPGFLHWCTCRRMRGCGGPCAARAPPLTFYDVLPGKASLGLCSEKQDNSVCDVASGFGENVYDAM